MHGSAVRRAALLVLCATVGQTSSARAQETIASDRPGVGSGSYVLARGVTQIETGLELARADGADSYSLGQLVVRVGIPPVELELLANSYLIQRAALASSLQDAEGFQDLAFGVKVPLVRGDGPIALSIQGLLVTPTGSDELTDDAWQPARQLVARRGPVRSSRALGQRGRRSVGR